jgi:hypothetical protein
VLHKHIQAASILYVFLIRRYVAVLLKDIGEGLIVLSVSDHLESVLAKYILGCLVHEL